jgi:hypothetical protein
MSPSKKPPKAGDAPRGADKQHLRKEFVGEGEREFYSLGQLDAWTSTPEGHPPQWVTDLVNEVDGRADNPAVRDYIEETIREVARDELTANPLPDEGEAWLPRLLMPDRKRTPDHRRFLLAALHDWLAATHKVDLLMPPKWREWLFLEHSPEVPLRVKNKKALKRWQDSRERFLKEAKADPEYPSYERYMIYLTRVGIFWPHNDEQSTWTGYLNSIPCSEPTTQETIQTSQAIKEYYVSRATLRRRITKEKLPDLRKKGHEPNAVHLFRRADLNRQFDRKL